MVDTLKQQIDNAIEMLKGLNSSESLSTAPSRKYRLQKVLVANRGEIAKRFFLALHEEGIASVAIVTEADEGQSWYDFADEVILIGDSMNYTAIPVVIGAAIFSGANAIYPGYGFLSENAEFVDAISNASSIYKHEIIFMGPSASVMKKLGDKIEARLLAREHNIPLLEGSDAINSMDDAVQWAAKIGYPVMVKLSAAGGGRGIVIVRDPKELQPAVESSKRIGKTHYNDDTFFIEKYIEDPIHMEVQIFNEWAIGSRKCAVQRNNQKIIEESGQVFLDNATYLAMLAESEKMARVSGYADNCGAGTVEFLMDANTGKFGFLEVNTRLQVEYGVTEQAMGIDLVKWQILHFDNRSDEIAFKDVLQSRFGDNYHAIECRINAEEPENDYRPSPGEIDELVLPTFHGIRCDFGFQEGDHIPPLYDAMLGKVIATGSTRQEAIIRLERALQELYIKGFHTNLKQLLRIIRHERFIKGDYTNKLLTEYPELQFQDIYEATTDDAQVILLGTLTEYIKLYRKISSDFRVKGTLDTSLQNRALTSLPYRFTVEYREGTYQVEIYQNSFDTFFMFLNNDFHEKVVLSNYNDENDDYLFRMGTRFFRIKAEKRIGHISIRMKDSSNKMNYFRLKVQPEGMEDTRDPQGMARAPFQCTFVSIAKKDDKEITVGTVVDQDDPIFIVSSMKMETVLTAPVSGTLDYLLDNGDLDKLIKGTTSDGKILGKGIEESEILFIVKSHEDQEKEETVVTPIKSSRKNSLELNALYDRGLVKEFFTNKPETYLRLVITVTRSFIQGYIQPDDKLPVLGEILQEMLSLDIDKYLDEKIISRIILIINHYRIVKQLFSPVILDGLSYIEELNYYINSIYDFEYSPPAEFQKIIDEAVKYYGIEKSRPTAEKDDTYLSLVVLHLQRSYFIAVEHGEIIGHLLSIIRRSTVITEELYSSLVLLYANEQFELDDSLAMELLAVLNEKFPGRSEHQIISRETTATVEPMNLERDGFVLPQEKKILTSLEKPEKDLVPAALSPQVKEDLSAHLSKMGESNIVARLYTGDDTLLLYSVRPTGAIGKDHYVAMAYITEPVMDKDETVNSKVISSKISQLLSLITLYNDKQSGSGNRFELSCIEHPVDRDNITGSISLKLFKELSRSVTLAYSSFTADNITGLISMSHGDGRDNYSHYLVDMAQQPHFDIITEKSTLYPYHEPCSNGDAKVYGLGKWTVEDWASFCFDEGSYSEIEVKHVDDVEGKDGIIPVAGRIFMGPVMGSQALFYMKDSRIRAGATGDLEGLKYVAAVYIAKIHGVPVYVWNDGAGANINEGMVSLNRGGQGFMVNSLLSRDIDADEFGRLLMENPDPKLQQVVAGVRDDYTGIPVQGHTFAVAVGVGSSAGLDVYGSSQAAIQVLLDSPQSYRVLTGANVIKSVMGEDISNYDIGGARVMGQWAGIIDSIAPTKHKMTTCIRMAQTQFAVKKKKDAIVRRSGKEASSSYTKRIVFTEERVLDNIDYGRFLHFKEDYHAAKVLLGGFASLGGENVLIMGPRNNEGITSYNAITRARELVKTAHRTYAHQILVFGKQFYQDTDYLNPSGIRVRMDFLQELRTSRGFKIAIVTDVQGMHSVELTSLVDAIIFIRHEESDEKIMELALKNSTFVVESFSQAFDLSRDLIDMVTEKKRDASSPLGVPDIPVDAGTPYDMIENVIRPVADNGTFLEFYREMNDPNSGPTLITGLVRIAGDTMAVIADQPKAMGGGADAPGTEKFRIFTQFANRNNIPILMLSNSSGFVPGVKQERLRIQAIGGDSLDANILGEVPVVSLVLKQNFGGRQIQAFNKFLRPGIAYLALENATLAVMGAQMAFNLMKQRLYDTMIDEGKKKEADAMRDEFISGYEEKSRAQRDALETGCVDTIVARADDIREEIVTGLVLARERCAKAFGQQEESI